MAELLANSPVAGKREPIGELNKELKTGEGAGTKLVLKAAVAKSTGLQAAGETRVLIETPAGEFELVRIKTTAEAWTEAEVLERAAEETTEANLHVAAKVFCLPTRISLPKAVIGASKHNELGGLTEGDPHTQYAKLLGRAGGGQELIGGTEVQAEGVSQLKLRGTSASAVDIVGWHYRLEGPKLQAEAVELFGAKTLSGVATTTFKGGNFAIEKEQFVVGEQNEALPIKTIAGTVEEGALAAEVCALALEPTGGAAVLGALEWALGALQHRLLLVINISETETVTLENERVAGTKAESRFHFASAPSNVKLTAGSCIWLYHCEGSPTNTKRRWRDIGGTSKNFP